MRNTAWNDEGFVDARFLGRYVDLLDDDTFSKV